MNNYPVSLEDKANELSPIIAGFNSNPGWERDLKLTGFYLYIVGIS